MSPNRRTYLAATLCTLAVAPLLLADDLVFHSSGKTYQLERSSTELYLRMDEPVAATRAKLAVDARCAIEPIPWAAMADSHCLVRTTQPDVSASARLRAIPGVASVRPVYRIVGSDTPILSSGNLVVKLDSSMTAAERTEFFADYRVSLVNVLDPQNDVYTVQPIGSGEEDDVRSAAAMYGDDRTSFAHPDFIVPVERRQILSQFEDEFFAQQWHLNNTGQGGGTLGADINVEDAWRITFGEDVLMGIFDDSVDVAHIDLLANYIGVGHDVLLGIEGALATNPRNINDFHGTNVIGLALADANDFGGVGVAPAALFTASRGLSDPVSLGQIASAYVFARQRDVMVHVNSWGLVNTLNSQADVLVSAIQAAFEEGREGRGMVIVFAAGNSAEELGPDDDLSALPEVIGVGASNANDALTSFTNFGSEIDVVAPSGDAFLPGLVTTDNTDDAGFVNLGLNIGGSSFDAFGNPIPDLPDPDFTQHFGGTSGSCPIVAGVAALIISANQDLTASQVRTIIEQTSVKVDLDAADYHPITERSLTHGYGRVNAGAAVEAAANSRENGNFTWPDRLRSVGIGGGVLIWSAGDDIRELDLDDDPDTPALEVGEFTTQTMVIESLTPFSDTNTFIPSDGVTYSVGQTVAPGITVVHFDQATAFALPSTSGTRYYALFPLNTIARYGFGVTIDTNGVVNGIGVSPGDDGASSPPPSVVSAPRPSIHVTPLSGVSPLDVEFRGNALSENPIDSVLWDFEDGETSTRAATTHRYTVSGAETRRFFPTFTVTDTFGNVGTRSIAIDVSGEGATGSAISGEIRIVAGLPGSVGSDVNSGVSPFSVELNIEGVAAGTIRNVRWDLGDGAEAETISVPHTYINNSDVARTLPISVEVESMSITGATVTQTDTKFITVDPHPNPSADILDTGTVDTGDATTTSNQTTQPVPVDLALCGAGSVTAMLGILLMSFVRRRFV